jgi:hypothetical protein
LKRVLNHARRDVRAAEPVNRDDIEAAPAIETAGPSQVVEGHRANAAPLSERHGFRGIAVPFRRSRFDLDEHDHAVVVGDDVNFSKPGAVASGKNDVPTALELATREIFARFSEALPVERRGHGTYQSKRRASANVAARVLV